jgi:prepilin-type N-terminal cleavage/methylation domain-containing protein
MGIRAPDPIVARRIDGAGFTLIEVLIVVAIVGVLASIALSYMISARRAAYETTAHHDLDQFVKDQVAAYGQNERFAGEVGQSIRQDPAASDFSLQSFRPSAGVVITVVSGDPATPYDSTNPYVARARHQSAPGIFEYNFATGQTTEQ